MKNCPLSIHIFPDILELVYSVKRSAEPTRIVFIFFTPILMLSLHFFQQTPVKVIRKKRSTYSKENLARAYSAVKQSNQAIRTAARTFGVPVQTLRDRVIGIVDPDNDACGSDPLLTREEELTLVEHVEVLAELGYGYTNMQLKSLAGDLAQHLGRRPSSKPLSNNWLTEFLKRWHDRLRSLNPRSLEACRAKGSTPEIIESYYNELDHILEKYNLKDKPHLIYNLDETGLQPNHTPPNVIAPANSKPQSITSPRSTTVTLLGCINAIGNSLPPFFVFKGKRYNPDLMKGASTGAVGVMSESGWSNSTIFQQYLQDHFLRFKQSDADPSQHTLILYDGHASHVSSSLIDWAKNHQIVLFVLPPHTSHLLQPLDVAVFGPLKTFYNSECSLFMRRNIGQTINRFNTCDIACKAYSKAMTPTNIQAAFRKTGIYPFSKTIEPHKLYPSEGFREKEPLKKVVALKGGKEAVGKFLQQKFKKIESEKENINPKTQNTEKVCEKLKRPSPGGQAITEMAYEKKIKAYEISRPELKPKQIMKIEKAKKKKCLTPKSSEKKSPKNLLLPKPSTSGLHQTNLVTSEESDDESKKCASK